MRGNMTVTRRTEEQNQSERGGMIPGEHIEEQNRIENTSTTTLLREGCIMLENGLLLLTPESFIRHIPRGTGLISIVDEVVIVGRDHIDADTAEDGCLYFGVLRTHEEEDELRNGERTPIG